MYFVVPFYITLGKDMRDIDKNDVDVLALFNWKKPVVIKNGDKEVTIHMRVVGDNDLQRARVYAFRKSAELRNKLKTEGTDERVAFLQELESFTEKSLLVETILLLNMSEFRTKALRDVEVPLPQEPSSTASTEEQETYQRLVDEYPAKFADAVADHMETLVKKEREKLDGLSHNKLYAKYEKLLIDQLCTDELNRAYYSRLAYHACYVDEDCKYNLFETFEEFDNTPPMLKEYLVDEYQKLELGLDKLKK